MKNTPKITTITLLTAILTSCSTTPQEYLHTFYEADDYSIVALGSGKIAYIDPDGEIIH